MATHAIESFAVKLSPQPLVEQDETSLPGRMSIDKVFSGDLQGISRGEMLVAGTAIKGSAGYVAIERVSGRLHGKTGTFVLQHTGVMNRGAPQLTVTVVPDPGTDELIGISGTFAIKIVESKHLYEFDYILPSKE